MNDRFVYEHGDGWPYPIDDMDTSKILVLLILLEREVPGTLAHVLRTCAIIDGGYHIMATSQSPQTVRKCMAEIANWLDINYYDESEHKEADPHVSYQ